MKDPETGMTDKQRLFADEYCVTMNATGAYRKVYPNVKNYNVAAVNAHNLLKKPNMRAYIDQRIAEIQSAKTADAREVMEYLTSVLRGESEASVVVMEGCGDGCTKATIVVKPPDERERLKAAELLGKRHNLFGAKIDINGAVPVVITGSDDLAD